MAIGRATSREQVELAAASWLAEINRVNGAVRAAQTRIQRERDATDALAAELDRLTAIAEASRAMAESAVEACREARAALAATPGEEVAGAAGGQSERVGGGADLGSPRPARTGPGAQTQPAAIPARGANPAHRARLRSPQGRRRGVARRAASAGRPRVPLPNRRSQERRSSCAGRSRPPSFASCSATAPR